MKINKFFFLYFLLFIGCATTVSEKNIINDVVNNFIKTNAKSNYILINIDEQKLIYKSKFRTYKYPISSSVNGLGNKKNSYKTPFGEHIVSEKIGENLPLGAVFKGRKWTQEVIKPIKEEIDIPEDVITTRILWLDGLEDGVNKGGDVDSKERFIYIHGTAEEGLIGKPASIGCIRMKNKDVIKLFNRVKENTKVLIYSKNTQYF